VLSDEKPFDASTAGAFARDVISSNEGPLAVLGALTSTKAVSRNPPWAKESSIIRQLNVLDCGLSNTPRPDHIAVLEL